MASPETFKPSTSAKPTPGPQAMASVMPLPPHLNITGEGRMIVVDDIEVAMPRTHIKQSDGILLTKKQTGDPKRIEDSKRIHVQHDRRQVRPPHHFDTLFCLAFPGRN